MKAKVCPKKQWETSASDREGFLKQRTINPRGGSYVKVPEQVVPFT
jgi:hypothetical protein